MTQVTTGSARRQPSERSLQKLAADVEDSSNRRFGAGPELPVSSLGTGERTNARLLEGEALRGARHH
jgi:hypothetical protein